MSCHSAPCSLLAAVHCVPTHTLTRIRPGLRVHDRIAYEDSHEKADTRTIVNPNDGEPLERPDTGAHRPVLHPMKCCTSSYANFTTPTLSAAVFFFPTATHVTYSAFAPHSMHVSSCGSPNGKPDGETHITRDYTCANEHGFTEHEPITNANARSIEPHGLSATRPPFRLDAWTSGATIPSRCLDEWRHTAAHTAIKSCWLTQHVLRASRPRQQRCPQQAPRATVAVLSVSGLHICARGWRRAGARPTQWGNSSRCVLKSSTSLT